MRVHLKTEIDYVLEGWDKTDPKVQRETVFGLVAELAELKRQLAYVGGRLASAERELHTYHLFGQATGKEN